MPYILPFTLLSFRFASPLLVLPTLQNVTLTPHIAGASLKTVRMAAGQAADEVA